TGSGTLSYQWQFNGTNIPGATASTLVLNGVQVANVGTYVALVSSPYGSVASTPVQLNLGVGQCTPAPSGLVGWWQGELTATDLINANNGTLHGSVTYGSGMVGD